MPGGSRDCENNSYKVWPAVSFLFRGILAGNNNFDSLAFSNIVFSPDYRKLDEGLFAVPEDYVKYGLKPGSVYPPAINTPCLFGWPDGIGRPVLLPIPAISFPFHRFLDWGGMAVPGTAKYSRAWPAGFDEGTGYLASYTILPEFFGFGPVGGNFW